MSRIDDAIICVALGESVQHGEICPGRVNYSINKVTLKCADSRRLTRYAILLNGVWKSNEYYKWRETLLHLRDLSKMFTRKMTLEEMRKLCIESGGKIALYRSASNDPLEWSEYLLIYNGAVVGSEYTTPEDVKGNVARLKGMGLE